MLIVPLPEVGVDKVAPLEAMMFPHVVVEDQAEVGPQAKVMDQVEAAAQGVVMDQVEAAAQGVVMTALVVTRNMAVGLAVDGVRDLQEVVMTPRPTTSR